MQYIIFACSLIFIFFNNFVSKNLQTTNIHTPNLKKRFFRLLQFAKFAPLLAFLVIVVLVATYLHSKAEIRLSHAWYVSQFWAYSALMYCFYRIAKNKLSLIFMAISFFIAIYNTPLFHYENLFNGWNVFVSVLFGILMFLSMWITIPKITNKLRS